MEKGNLSVEREAGPHIDDCIFGQLEATREELLETEINGLENDKDCGSFKLHESNRCTSEYKYLQKLKIFFHQGFINRVEKGSKTFYKNIFPELSVMEGLIHREKHILLQKNLRTESCHDSA